MASKQDPEYAIHREGHHVVSTHEGACLSDGFFTRIDPPMSSESPVAVVLRAANAALMHPKDSSGQEDASVVNRVFFARDYAIEFVGEAKYINDVVLNDDLCHKIGASLMALEMAQESEA